MIGGQMSIQTLQGHHRLARDRTGQKTTATAESTEDDLPPIEAILDTITRVAASSTARMGRCERRPSGLPLIPPIQGVVPDSNLIVQVWHNADGLPDLFSACGRHMFPAGPRLIIARETSGGKPAGGSGRHPSIRYSTELPPSLTGHHFQEEDHVLSFASVGPLSLPVRGPSPPSSTSTSPNLSSRSKYPVSAISDPADCSTMSPLPEGLATELVSALNCHLALLPRQLPILIPTHTGGLLGLRAILLSSPSTDILPVMITISQPTVLPPMCPLLIPTPTLPHSDLTASLFDCQPHSHPLSDLQVVAQYTLGPGVFATVRWRASRAPAAVHAFVAANTARTWRGIELGPGLLASHPEVTVHVHQVESMGSPQVRKVEREIGQCIRWWRIQEGEETWSKQDHGAEGQTDEQEQEEEEGEEEADGGHPRSKTSRPAKRAKKLGVADHVDAFLEHLSNLGNDPCALFDDDKSDEEDDGDLDAQQPSLITDADLATSPTMSCRLLPNRTDHDFTERLWTYLRTARDADDLTAAMEAIVDAIESGVIVPQVSPSNPSYFAGTLRKALAYSALQATSVVKAKALEEVTQELDIFVDDPMSQLLEVSLWKLARDCMHYFTELGTLGAITPVGEWAQLDQLDMMRVLRAWIKALAVVVHVDTYAPGLPRLVLDGLAARLVSQRLAHLRPEEEADGASVGLEVGQEEEEEEEERGFDADRAAGGDQQGDGEHATQARNDSHLGSFPLPTFSPDTAQFVARLPPASRWTVTLASRTTADDASSSALSHGGDDAVGDRSGGALLDAVWTIDVRQRDDLAGMLSGDELDSVERAKVSMGEHPDTDTPRFEVTVGKAECFLV